MTAKPAIVNARQMDTIGVNSTKATRKVVDMKVMLQRMYCTSARILTLKMHLSILLDAYTQRPSTSTSRRPMVFLD